MIVADTDVLIDVLHVRSPLTERIAAEIRSRTLATTAVTAFELLSGARSGTARRAVDALLAPLIVLPLDQAAADVAAVIRRELESEGAGIGMADYLIAGICRARDASLLTRNEAHFGRIKGLRLVQE